MSIFATFADLDPNLQLVGILAVFGLIILLVWKLWSYAMKRRNRGKIWLIY
jgi:hypothetical protein